MNIYKKLFLKAAVPFGLYGGIAAGLFAGFLKWTKYGPLIGLFTGLKAFILVSLFAGIAFGLLMTWFLGVLHHLHMHFLGIKGDLEPIKSRSILLDLSLQEAFQKCLEACLNLKWSVQEENTESGFLRVKTIGINNLPVDINLVQLENQTQLTISNTPTIKDTVIDFGTGLLKILKLFEQLAPYASDPNQLDLERLEHYRKNSVLLNWLQGLWITGYLVVMLSLMVLEFIPTVFPGPRSISSAIALFLSFMIILLPLVGVLFALPLPIKKRFPKPPLQYLALVPEIVLFSSLWIFQHPIYQYWLTLYQVINRFLHPFLG